MNKTHMDEDSKNMETTFFTQIKERRPRTSYIVRNKTQLHHQLSLDPEIDPAMKLKTYKEELKKLEHEYQHTLVRLNESKKVIDKNYRDSQKKKIQFLNLYQNRKLKLVEQKLIENKQLEEQKCKSELRERAKTMKLNNEIRSLLIKNEVEENNSQICLKNKQDKKIWKEQAVRKRQMEFQQARKSFSRIKAGEAELHGRRKRIEQIQMTMAKQNYFKKLQRQLKAIQNIDQQLNIVCDMGSISNNFTEGKSFFITDKLE